MHYYDSNNSNYTSEEIKKREGIRRLMEREKLENQCLCAWCDRDNDCPKKQELNNINDDLENGILVKLPSGDIIRNRRKIERSDRRVSRGRRHKQRRKLRIRRIDTQRLADRSMGFSIYDRRKKHSEHGRRTKSRQDRRVKGLGFSRRSSSGRRDYDFSGRRDYD